MWYLRDDLRQSLHIFLLNWCLVMHVNTRPNVVPKLSNHRLHSAKVFYVMDAEYLLWIAIALSKIYYVFACKYLSRNYDKSGTTMAMRGSCKTFNGHGTLASAYLNMKINWILVSGEVFSGLFTQEPFYKGQIGTPSWNQCWGFKSWGFERTPQTKWFWNINNVFSIHCY